MGGEVNRDIIWKLEHGIPKQPDPRLVNALADALGRPLQEALLTLGYEIPEPLRQHIDPALVEAIDGLPLPVQRSLAGAIPQLLDLARTLERPALQLAAERGPQYRG